MNSFQVDLLAPKTLLALIAVAASLASPLSQAQQVYRITGPDGKITFSDQPPPSGTNAKVKEITYAASTNARLASLPLKLRQVAQKYPVVLYTGENCQACGQGRAMLARRGIPFNEKTVTTAQDSEALERLGGETALPLLTIGSQHIKGFSDTEWTQYLNAAGYPPTSALPASYRQPMPMPLADSPPSAHAAGEAPPTAPAPAATSDPAPRRILKPVPAPTPVTGENNPAGIKF
jgi:glutaredoxin